MMRPPERFMIDNSWGLSTRQCVAIAILFIIILMIAHDLTYSAHYEDVQQGTSDQLADIVEAGGSVTRRGAFFVLLICGIAILAGAWNEDRWSNPIRNNAVLACFLAMTFLSILWSGDPALTFRRSSEYLFFCVGAAAAGRLLGIRGVVWLAFLGSAGFLLVGLLSEAALGTFHPFTAEYRFCGTLHPNHQAWNCSLLLLSGSALLPRIRGVWRTGYFLVMTLGVVCLFLTKSRTSLACGVVALIIFWIGRIPLKQKLALVFGLGTLLVGALYFATFLSSKTASQMNDVLLAGRDNETYESFSGRIPLWKIAMDYVGQRPLAGYGFNSFWTPDRTLQVSSEVHWAVPHSHNDYIELLLGVGAIGLLLYLYQLASSWWLLRSSYLGKRDPLVRFYVALLVFYLACMFTEAIAFDMGLPTFCLLSMLWSRRSWFSYRFARKRATTAIPSLEPVQT